MPYTHTFENVPNMTIEIIIALITILFLLFFFVIIRIEKVIIYMTMILANLIIVY